MHRARGLHYGPEVTHGEGTIVPVERQFRPKEAFAELVELMRMHCPRAIDSPAAKSFAPRTRNNMAVGAALFAAVGAAILLYGITSGKENPLLFGVRAS
jgi:hypothetical protein